MAVIAFRHYLFMSHRKQRVMGVENTDVMMDQNLCLREGGEVYEYELVL